jgi:hypothetical protein
MAPAAASTSTAGCPVVGGGRRGRAQGEEEHARGERAWPWRVTTSFYGKARRLWVGVGLGSPLEFTGPGGAPGPAAPARSFSAAA